MAILTPPLPPQPLGLGYRIDTALFPPFLLVTDGVERSVVRSTERHDPLVADLASDRSGLGKAHMVGLSWRTPADEAGLGGHVAEMLLVPDPARRADGKGRFVDPAWFFRTRVSIRISALTNLRLRVMST